MTTRRPRHPAARSVPAERLRAPLVLSLVALGSMALASVLGLLVNGLYGLPASTAEMLRGYDLVTLVLAVPALGVSLAGVRRGSVLAQLVWLGVLASVVYTYAFHLFGTAFNDAFLLHVLVFSSAFFALVLALSSLDAPSLALHFGVRTPVRSVSGVLAFLAVGLGGMWLFAYLRLLTTGAVPEGSALVETEGIVHLGIALDLVFLVPAYALGAVLLWRRRAWGYVLAALLLVSGTVHQAGYLVAMPFQAAADVPGATRFDALEVPIALAITAGMFALLSGLRRGSTGRVGQP